MDAVAQELDGKNAQLVVICGRNEAVKQRLEGRDWPVRMEVRGFVSDMNLYMEASDVLLTKAGPGTIAEAAALGLPVFLTGFLPGQERGNVLWVREKNIGELAKSPQRAATTVSKWLRDQDALVEMSRNAKAAAKPKATEQDRGRLMGLVEGVQRTATGVLRDLKERAPSADWSLYGALNSTARSAVAELRDQLAVRRVPLEAR